MGTVHHSRLLCRCGNRPRSVSLAIDLCSSAIGPKLLLAHNRIIGCCAGKKEIALLIWVVWHVTPLSCALLCRAAVAAHTPGAQRSFRTLRLLSHPARGEPESRGEVCMIGA